MYGRTRIIPVLEGIIRSATAQPARHFWENRRGPLAVGDFFNDVERQMDRFERLFFRNNPLRIMMPRFMPIEGKEASMDSNYRINIDVQDFKPEDIKISLKDGILRIQASMDKTSEDGSRFQQSIVREYKLPQNVEANSVKSLLHDNGILSIEATVNKENEPRGIPIQHLDASAESKN